MSTRIRKPRRTRLGHPVGRALRRPAADRGQEPLPGGSAVSATVASTTARTLPLAWAMYPDRRVSTSNPPLARAGHEVNAPRVGQVQVADVVLAAPQVVVAALIRARIS